MPKLLRLGVHRERGGGQTTPSLTTAANKSCRSPSNREHEKRKWWASSSSKRHAQRGLFTLPILYKKLFSTLCPDNNCIIVWGAFIFEIMEASLAREKNKRVTFPLPLFDHFSFHFLATIKLVCLLLKERVETFDSMEAAVQELPLSLNWPVVGLCEVEWALLETWTFQELSRWFLGLVSSGRVPARTLAASADVVLERRAIVMALLRCVDISRFTMVFLVIAPAHTEQQ